MYLSMYIDTIMSYIYHYGYVFAIQSYQHIGVVFWGEFLVLRGMINPVES